MAGSAAAVLVSAGAAWEVSVRAGKTGHLDPLRRTLVKNAFASG